MKLSDLERKLLVLAFDPDAAPGEIADALKILFKGWLSRYPDGHELVKDLELERVFVENRNPYEEVCLGFGKISR